MHNSPYFYLGDFPKKFDVNGLTIEDLFEKTWDEIYLQSTINGHGITGNFIINLAILLKIIPSLKSIFIDKFAAKTPLDSIFADPRFFRYLYCSTAVYDTKSSAPDDSTCNYYFDNLAKLFCDSFNLTDPIKLREKNQALTNTYNNSLLIYDCYRIRTFDKKVFEKNAKSALNLWTIYNEKFPMTVLSFFYTHSKWLIINDKLFIAWLKSRIKNKLGVNAKFQCILDEINSLEQKYSALSMHLQ